MPLGDLRLPCFAPLGAGFFAVATRSIADPLPAPEPSLQHSISAACASRQTIKNSEGPGREPRPSNQIGGLALTSGVAEGRRHKDRSGAGTAAPPSRTPTAPGE